MSSKSKVNQLNQNLFKGSMIGGAGLLHSVYWRHEIQLHRSDLSDRPSSGQRLLEDIDTRMLQALEAEPWASVRAIAEFLRIPVSMVHLHLTTFLNTKIRHFKWVPHFLDDSRAKRLGGGGPAVSAPLVGLVERVLVRFFNRLTSLSEGSHFFLMMELRLRG
jgi:hypothetical protein